MISNVNFTGRETLLTEGVGVAAAKTIDTIHNYVGVGTITFPKMEDTFVKEVKAAKEVAAEGIAKIKKSAFKSENAELSYAVSHGKPKSELVEMFGKNIDYKA